jgi:hypothetical protein
MINKFKQKVKESQTYIEKKEPASGSLVKQYIDTVKLYTKIKIMARPPRIELGSQASEAYVISIGPRAQQKLL